METPASAQDRSFLGCLPNTLQQYIIPSEKDQRAKSGHFRGHRPFLTWIVPTKDTVRN